MIYFVPEGPVAYARLGIAGRDGYFASRSAPMGAVSAEVVIATFFNFNPELVHSAIPGAWGSPRPMCWCRPASKSLTAVCGDFSVTTWWHRPR